MTALHFVIGDVGGKIRKKLVGTVGFEPTTYRLSDDYSTAELRPYGGGGEIRTPDARHVTPALFR